MSASQSKSPGQPLASPLFATTHWSVVLAAKQKTSPDRARALESLCRTYWFPLYAFVRSSGYSPQDAQDLTQEFFAQLLAKDYLGVVDPEKGRFRTFLKMALKRFLAKDRGRLRALKRGGGQIHISLDTTVGETQFQQQAVASLDPEGIYDWQWALALLAETVSRLEHEYQAGGRANEFQHLKAHLTADRGTIPYVEIAARLQMSEGAARVAMHRLRKRFRIAFREVIAETVALPTELDQEVRYILTVLDADKSI
jgi:DNA-directed RNA polymerase specialized sigma24 family protein